MTHPAREGMRSRDRRRRLADGERNVSVVAVGSVAVDSGTGGGAVGSAVAADLAAAAAFAVAGWGSQCRDRGRHHREKGLRHAEIQDRHEAYRVSD